MKLSISLALAFLLVATSLFGQDPNLPSGEINQKDENGRKVGTWVIFAKEKNLAKYPPDNVYEVGEYVNGRKEGVWKRFYPSGNLLSEITKKNGRNSGEFTTYHDKPGAISEQGAMSPNGRQMSGPHKMINSEGVVTIEKNYGADGRMEGKQIYRYPNGQVEFEFEKKEGKNTGTATRYFANGDVKEVIKYNVDGSVASSDKKKRVNPPYVDPNAGPPAKPAPKPPSGLHIQVGGKKIPVGGGVKIPDGPQKVFNEAGDILYDGKFKGGRFDNGKFYVYDSDGLLDHIEVFKNGKYAANGVITD